jgi:single-strand DNA-binding protein
MMYTKARGDFIGRLTRDAELKFTGGGLPVCNFSLVTDDRTKNAATGEYDSVPSFWDCQLFGKQAESLAQYLTKGKLIGLDGSLRIEQWEQDGQKRMKAKINVSNIILLATDKREGSEPKQAAPQSFEDQVPF